MTHNVTVPELINELERLRSQISEEQARSGYAETDYDDRGYRLWRLAAQTGHVPVEADNDATAEYVISQAIKERDALAAKINRVEALLHADRRDWVLPTIAEATLRGALADPPAKASTPTRPPERTPQR
jgi:hypothetical protein